MNKDFDRILEYLKKGDYSDAFPDEESVIPFEGKYDEFGSETSENWILYASITEFDPTILLHHGCDYTDGDVYITYPEGLPTHVARIVTRNVSFDENGQSAILYLVDGELLKFIVTEDEVRMINVDDWDGNQPSFFGGYIYDSKKWCAELAPVYYSNEDYHKELEEPPYSCLTKVLEFLEPKNDKPDNIYAWIKCMSMKIIGTVNDIVTVKVRVAYNSVELKSNTVVDIFTISKCEEFILNVIANDKVETPKTFSHPMYFGRDYRKWCEDLTDLMYQNFTDYGIGKVIK